MTKPPFCAVPPLDRSMIACGVIPRGRTGGRGASARRLADDREAGGAGESPGARGERPG
ncbi:hypothetical protein AB0L25_03910 [Spirillospora sp. NPDC052242]